MPRVILLLLILLPPLQAGEYGDAFLLAALPARSLGLGTTDIAMQGQGGWNLVNPAPSGPGEIRQFSASYHRFGSFLNESSLSYQSSLDRLWTLNIFAVTASADGLQRRPDLRDLSPQERRDSVRVTEGSGWGLLGHRESGILLNLSRAFEVPIDLGWKFFEIPMRVPVGVTLKLIDKDMDGNRGLGTGFDVGLRFVGDLSDISDALVNTHLTGTLSVLDILNTPVYWETRHQDAIKRRWIHGIGVEQNLPILHSSLRLATTRNALHAGKRQVGLEFQFGGSLSLRLGHDGTAPGFGIGLAYKKFIIDYAMGQHELQEKQKISLLYHFR